MQVTVTNIGEEQLTLKAPVSMGDFIVSLWSKTAIAPGESATAELYLITPYDGGAISFQHNLDPRDFVVSVTFDADDLLLVKDASDTIIIPNGDNTPNTGDGTDFGSTNVNTTVSKTYIIENIGILPTAVSISVPSGYTLVSAPSGVILPGEQDSFTVRFDASASGDTGGNITISTGSPNTYVFAITGHGNYYYEKVRSGLTQYLFQNELVGTVANDDSPENNDGVFSNVTLNAIDSPVPGDRAPSFNGTSGASASRVNLYSTALASDFNPLEGSIVVWAKVANAGVWTDGQSRYLLRLSATAINNNNTIYIIKPAASNILGLSYTAGGIAETRNKTLSETDWFQVALTWSKSNDRVRVYYNGVQEGADMTTLGVWSGALNSDTCNLGAVSISGSTPWSGYLSHYRLYNRELTAAEILELNTIP